MKSHGLEKLCPILMKFNHLSALDLLGNPGLGCRSSKSSHKVSFKAYKVKVGMAFKKYCNPCPLRLPELKW